MSCGCENKKLNMELERIKKLAKTFARMEETTATIYKNKDGTYGFCREDEETEKTIVEYITPY